MRLVQWAGLRPALTSDIDGSPAPLPSRGGLAGTGDLGSSRDTGAGAGRGQPRHLVSLTAERAADTDSN